MGQGACLCLVLKTNLGPVIHKSVVYQCLESHLCTVKGHFSHYLTAEPEVVSSSVRVIISKKPKSYINATLWFYLCWC